MSDDWLRDALRAAKPKKEVQPVRYGNTSFRSTLEARYAVLFDALAISWQYEPRRFRVESHASEACDNWPQCGDQSCWDAEPQTYLPDFFLPDSNIWVEVKGDEKRLNRMLLVEAVDAFSDWHIPGIQNPEKDWMNPDHGGVMVLGPLPPRNILAAAGRTSVVPLHTLLWHYKGVQHDFAGFVPGGVSWTMGSYGCHLDPWTVDDEDCDIGWLSTYQGRTSDFGSQAEITQAYLLAKDALFVPRTDLTWEYKKVEPR